MWGEGAVAWSLSDSAPGDDAALSIIGDVAVILDASFIDVSFIFWRWTDFKVLPGVTG